MLKYLKAFKSDQMFIETVLRLNYVVSYQTLLFGNRLKNRYSENSSYIRSSLKLSGSQSFSNCGKHLKRGSLDDILKKSDSLYERGLYDESLKLLYECPVSVIDRENAQILWREGRVLYRYMVAAVDKVRKQKIISTALQKLKNAVQLEERSHLIHIWMSVFLLRHVEVNSFSGNAFHYMNKAHIHMQRAIELAPDDPLVWFTVAYYAYNLADLPWVQRTVVLKALSSKPVATYESALEYFRKAESLKPGFCSLNLLMIAKCLIALNKVDEAESYLQHLANNLSVRNEDDKNSKESAEKLLQALKKRLVNKN